MKKQIIIFLLFPFFASALACQCSDKKKLDEARESEYNVSEIILVADVKVLIEDKRRFQITVLEIFKGQFEIGQTMQGLNNYYCEPHIDSTGKWLIYGKIEDGLLTINECGLSRSFANPEMNRYFWTLPPPLPRESTGNENTLQKEEIKIRKEDRIRAIAELENEILILRNKKKNDASVQH